MSKRKNKIVSSFFIIFIFTSCSINTAGINDDIKGDVSISKNVTKQVDIKILNPSNKSLVEWYKKDEKTVVMKVGSQA